MSTETPPTNNQFAPGATPIKMSFEMKSNSNPNKPEKKVKERVFSR